MRVLHFLVVLFGGLATAQQQALMDYLERRLLAIEVRLKLPVLPAIPAHPELLFNWNQMHIQSHFHLDGHA